MFRIFAATAVSVVALAGCGGAATAPAAPTVSAASYMAVVNPLNAKLASDYSAMGTACSGSDVQTCSAAAQTALSDGNTYMAALGTNGVPACLTDANNNLRDGLTMMTSGISTQMSGMRMNNAGPMNTRTGDVNTGNEKAMHAYTEMTAAAGACH